MIINQKFTDIASLSEELSCVEKASKISVPQIIQECIELRKGVLMISDELSNHKTVEDSIFYVTMKVLT